MYFNWLNKMIVMHPPPALISFPFCFLHRPLLLSSSFCVNLPVTQFWWWWIIGLKDLFFSPARRAFPVFGSKFIFKTSTVFRFGREWSVISIHLLVFYSILKRWFDFLHPFLMTSSNPKLISSFTTLLVYLRCISNILFILTLVFLSDFLLQKKF